VNVFRTGNNSLPFTTKVRACVLSVSVACQVGIISWSVERVHGLLKRIVDLLK
jgi:hypothetical protein